MDKQMKIQLTQTPFASKQNMNILDKTKAKDLDKKTQATGERRPHGISLRR
jgi:hypothetical protein